MKRCLSTRLDKSFPKSIRAGRSFHQIRDLNWQGQLSIGDRSYSPHRLLWSIGECRIKSRFPGSISSWFVSSETRNELEYCHNLRSRSQSLHPHTSSCPGAHKCRCVSFKLRWGITTNPYTPKGITVKQKYAGSKAL